jgi:predicted RNase H-like HicB family nuclease
MYRVGFPFWKVAARMGVPVLVRVNVHADAETKSYWADSPDLDGLVVSGATLEELRQEVAGAASGLLQLAVHAPRARAQTELRIRDAAFCVA